MSTIFDDLQHCHNQMIAWKKELESRNTPLENSELEKFLEITQGIGNIFVTTHNEYQYLFEACRAEMRSNIERFIDRQEDLKDAD